MYKDLPKLRRKVVRYYLSNNVSLKKTAAKFDLHYQTVYKWVKRYRSSGERGLLAVYKKPWNRIAEDVEKKIVALKERRPYLTIKRCQEILEEQGTKLSLHGIWAVWKRYGYAGFQKEKMGNDFTEHGTWSIEARRRFQQARALFNIGKIKDAAEVLNTIPFLPKNEFIFEIPEGLLNLRRRIERAYALFGKSRLSDYLKLLNGLYQKCKDRGLYYSAVRIGIPEIIALSWQSKTRAQSKMINELKRILNKGGGGSPPRRTCLVFDIVFTLLIGEANVCIDDLKIKKARAIATVCRRALTTRRKISPGFLLDISALCLRLYETKQAEYWYLKAMNRVDKEKRKRLKGYLAYQVYFPMGEFGKARKLLKEAELYHWLRGSWPLRFQALYFLTNGMPQKAISLATESLSLSRQEKIPGDIFNAYLIMAAAYNGLGERKTAEKLLATLHKYLLKNKLKMQLARLRPYLNVAPESSEELKLPVIKLGALIRAHKYSRAFSYARAKGISTLFHRYLFFFPEIVLQRIREGRSVKIPRKILRLPLFNRDTPVFHIKFLGDVVIYKNQQYHKIKLRPKEKAFLIHCALNLPEPEKTISLEKVYRNFWPGSKNPSRNLSLLMVRLRKKLRIPVHLLEPRRAQVLINCGLYFTTDYREFQEKLVRGHAFERAEEWEFARREYLQAFRLFRGEPFKKMYDPWSENMRRVILNKLETEALHFAKRCLAHKDKKSAAKVLEKVLRIIPGSEEVAGTLGNL